MIKNNHHQQQPLISQLYTMGCKKMLGSKTFLRNENFSPNCTTFNGQSSKGTSLPKHLSLKNTPKGFNPLIKSDLFCSDLKNLFHRREVHHWWIFFSPTNPLTSWAWTLMIKDFSQMQPLKIFQSGDHLQVDFLKRSTLVNILILYLLINPQCHQNTFFKF